MYDIVLRILMVLLIIGVIFGLMLYLYNPNIKNIFFGIFSVLMLFYVIYGVDIPIIFRGGLLILILYLFYYINKY